MTELRLSGRDLQRLLTAANYYKGGIDGDVGPRTLKAVGRILEVNASKIPLRMNKARQLVAAAQLVLDASGFEPGPIDGYAGHNTCEAFNSWAYEKEHNRKESFRTKARILRDPRETGWPQQLNIRAVFGGVGTNQTRIKLPYAMPLAWNLKTKVKTMTCHEKVADSVVQIFTRTVDHYGIVRVRKLGLDKFGGCLNVRKKRGGSTYSMHSWGVAIDLDPANNRLRWGADRAKFAHTDYNKFWQIVEETGATSLGRQANFDWMHFQFANL